MITITIVRNVEKAIIRFAVSGHAFYNDPGKDIVCAGVSAVTVGAVNAIEKLTGVIPDASSQSGLLKAVIPQSNDPVRNDQVQLLLEGMIGALESIVESYGKYVVMKQTFVEKGG